MTTTGSGTRLLDIGCGAGLFLSLAATAQVVIATWGRPEQCEAAGYVRAVASLLPDRPPDALRPFALSEVGALEEFAARGGLAPGERHEVLCVWTFADAESLVRDLKSTDLAVRAAEHAGEEKVTETVLEAVAPYRMSDGGYRLENVVTYVAAQIQGGRT